VTIAAHWLFQAWSSLGSVTHQPPSAPSLHSAESLTHKSCQLIIGVSFFSLLFLLNLTGPNWRQWEMQKGQTIDKQTYRKLGLCVHLEGDAQQPHCSFPLITLLLLRFFSLLFSSLFFKALLLYNSLKPCF
jgi:hypothetical protein